MPVPGHAEHLGGHGVDLVGQLLLTDAGADHRASLDLVEQLGRLGFGVQKPFHPYLFVGDRLLHPIDATAATASEWYAVTARSATAEKALLLFVEFLVSQGSAVAHFGEFA